MRPRLCSVPFALFVLLGAPSCLHEGADPIPLEEADGGLDAALVQGTGGVSFVSITHGDPYENPVLLAVAAPASVTEVKYDASGVNMGSSRDKVSGFALEYRFQNVGSRVVRAKAFNRDNVLVGEVSAQIRVMPSTVPTIAFVSPAIENGQYLNGIWFKVSAQGPPVHKVRYMAGQWSLGESKNAGNDFAVNYNFSQYGRRVVRAEALSENGRVLATATRTFTVVDPNPPAAPVKPGYFYQYLNDNAPDATCQNTSIAMILKGLGWQGIPDDITNNSRYGRETAQDPNQLAGVFNELAAADGISRRMISTTSGTIAGLRAELASGPVIVHGYMTNFGHVVVVTGFDGTHYTVNDPAGTWAGYYGGSYPDAYSEPTAGRGIRYPKGPFEIAIGSTDGGYSINDGSLWYHVLD